MYFAEACNEFAKPTSASLRHGNTASFEEMLQQWLHCAQFDRPEIWTSDLPLQRRARYRSTNWLVWIDYIVYKQVFQRRIANGSVNFYRNWANYTDGFGNYTHEFWLGELWMFIKFVLPLNFNLLFVEILKLNQGTVLLYIDLF